MTKTKIENVELLKLVSGEWVLCTVNETDEGLIMVDPYIYMIHQAGAMEYCAIDNLQEKVYPINAAHIITRTKPMEALAEQYLENVKELKARKAGVAVPKKSGIVLPGS